MSDNIDEQQAFQAQPATMPIFAKGFITTDIVFCSLRGLIGIMAIINFLLIQTKAATFFQLIETSTNIGIFCFGLAANILLLKNKPSGVDFAYVNIGCTIVNMLSGLIAVLLFTSQQAEVAKAFNIASNGILVISIRIALLIFYIIAIKKASDFLMAKKLQIT